MRFFGAGSGNKLVAKVIKWRAERRRLLGGGAVVSVLALSVTNQLISRFYVVSDQRKLAHVKRVLEQQ